jgi:hypothetical protein
MTSIPSFIKQIPTDARNFVPVSSLLNIIYGLNEATATFTVAPWAQGNAIALADGSAPWTASRYASSIAGPGAGKLKDMGKTYVSSGRTFRKVQLIVPGTYPNSAVATGAGVSTFGVAGQSEAAQPTADYLTGYIELGWEGIGSAAPVARAP